jgi:hypothetical protein
VTAPRELRPCGTEAAFRRHHRRRELACRECLVAHAKYEQERAATIRRVAA